MSNNWVGIFLITLIFSIGYTILHIFIGHDILTLFRNSLSISSLTTIHYFIFLPLLAYILNFFIRSKKLDRIKEIIFLSTIFLIF